MPSAPVNHLGSIPPKRVVVVGAGMVGLSTAWFLQEHGVDVTVVDRAGVGAGSSWGNAGWLSPGKVTPLPEPDVLRYSLRALFDPSASLSVPPSVDLALWRFLARFAKRCTRAQWRRAMQGYLAITRESLDVFDELSRGGVTAVTKKAPIMACFETSEQAAHYRREIENVVSVGQPLDVTELSAEAARGIVSQIGDRVQLVIQLNGQRYIDPGDFVTRLGDSVVARGAAVLTGFSVRSLRQGAAGVTVESSGGDSLRADAVVLATGAWLNQLARPFGVRMPVQAGRGYSLSVKTDEPVAAPIYLPTARVACTPYRDGLRIGGTMEFRSADHPLVPARVDALLSSARPWLSGVQWRTVSDFWVGPRPVSADGMPLIGATRSAKVFVAGGHGMWGVTLGPVTGKLLASQIVSGRSPDALSAFNPLR
ncbi:MAG: FAD-dependent oxidoreductase [Acidimicrobiales bacterium]|jgi:D-amino-acid dehydrogenase